MLSTTVSATIGVASLCLGGVVSWAHYGALWWVWWLGDAVGDLVVAPVLLTWGARSRLIGQPRRVVEVGILLVSLVGGSHLLFGGWLATEPTHHVLAYAVFPLVIWAALRFGQRGAATATLVISGIAIWGTARGFGPFMGETLIQRLILLQTFMLVVAVTAMVLAAIFFERKRAEEALRESEERFRNLFESMQAGVYRTSPDGRILHANSALVNMLGYTSYEELAARNLEKEGFAVGYSRREFRERIDREGEVKGMEALWTRRDNSVIVVREYAKAVRDANGAVLYYEGTVEDITERKRAEEALRESEDRYRDLVENSGMLIGTHDLKGCPECQPAWIGLLDAERTEDLLGRNIRDFLAPDVRHLFDSYLDTVVKEGHAHGLMKIQARSGEEKILEYDNSLRREGLETPIVRCLAHNVTEPKRAEAALRALYRANVEIQTPLALTDRLDRLLQTARDVLSLDRLNILLADPKGEWLHAVASLGTEEPLEAIRVSIGPEGGGLAQAYLTQQMIVWDGGAPVPEGLRLQPPYDRIAALRSQVFANVPLVVQGRAIGVLGADRKHSRRPLSPSTLDLLQLFATQAALAIEQARLYEELRLSAVQLEAKVKDRTQALQEAMREAEEAPPQVGVPREHVPRTAHAVERDSRLL
jgi:PAS domain S-box-containing protein